MITCVIILLINGVHVNYELDGYIVESRSDYWLVDFSHALNERNLKTETQVLRINSNFCLVKQED